MRDDRAQGPINPPHQTPSLSSVAPATTQVGNLVMRAMALLESNREMAWRCLRDASTLLGEESGVIGVNRPPMRDIPQPGGLVAWKADRALEYIERNLGSRLTIREMADCVALSASHFSRAFKLSLGATPMAYVAARRVARAKLMMTSTREKLMNIALECGFSDQPHLTKCFRRIVGMSPGMWRRISIRNLA